MEHLLKTGIFLEKTQQAMGVFAYNLTLASGTDTSCSHKILLEALLFQDLRFMGPLNFGIAKNTIHLQERFSPSSRLDKNYVSFLSFSKGSTEFLQQFKIVLLALWRVSKRKLVPLLTSCSNLIVFKMTESFRMKGSTRHGGFVNLKEKVDLQEIINTIQEGSDLNTKYIEERLAALLGSHLSDEIHLAELKRVALHMLDALFPHELDLH